MARIQEEDKHAYEGANAEIATALKAQQQRVKELMQSMEVEKQLRAILEGDNN